MVVAEAYIRRALERSEDEVKARLVLEVPWRCAALGAALEKMQCVGCGFGRCYRPARRAMRAVTRWAVLVRKIVAIKAELALPLSRTSTNKMSLT